MQMLEKVKKAIQERIGEEYAIFISEATINRLLTSSEFKKVILHDGEIRIYFREDVIIVKFCKTGIKLVSGFGYKEPVNEKNNVVL